MLNFILAPLIAALVAQIIKFFIKSNHTSFSWKNIVAYSGMPSSHAAMTIALTTMIGIQDGITKPAFAIALTFAAITIRDAFGLRQQIGRQGKMINKLTKDLDEDNLLDDRYPHLLERVGHTPAQLAVGSILGVLVAVVISWF